jgi:hypothetical protein
MLIFLICSMPSRNVQNWGTSDGLLLAFALFDPSPTALSNRAMKPGNQRET